MTTRRNFIKTSGAALGSAALLSAIPMGLMGCNPAPSLSFGFQTWTLRDQLGEDLPGTLKMMADKGYKEMEFCSPIGYKGTPFEQFREMGGKALKQIISDSGLKCISSHFNMGEMRDELDQSIEWAQEMGINQIICSSFWLAKEATVDDYRKSCDELNEIALKIDEAGLQTGFHNHHMEFETIDGELIYDALLESLAPELVKMQFQVAVVNIGYQAADYFRKYPGRFISAHLSDYSNEKEAQVAVGQGIVDWPDFFEAAKVGGVKNFFVEMDPVTFAESAAFLKTV
ncbi:MAG: sugar phosphate isomerase/epimerase [Bacteroidales bacterium]|jgi:sugar phosphate isomerase/epimerase|nr:sugar phosphate isomerase/epimerase [Bacteroidales bacterium]